MAKILGLKLWHQALVLLSVALAFELLFIGALLSLLTQAEQQAATLAHSNKIVAAAESLQRHNFEASMSFGLWVFSGAKFSKQKFNRLFFGFPAELSELRGLCADDRSQLETVDELINIQREAERVFALVSADVGKRVNDMQELVYAARLQKLGTASNVLLEKLVARERTKLPSPDSGEGTREKFKQVLFVGILLNILIAIGLAWFFNRSTSRRVNVLLDNTDRFSRNLPLSPVLDGADEFAALDRVFHNMVDQRLALERFKQEFTAMISHDLRTPLTSIRATLRLIADGAYGNLKAEGEERVENAERSCLRLIGLISDLLDLDQINAGKLELMLEPYPIGDILDESSIAVQAFAEQKAVKIDMPKTTLIAEVDGKRIIQVLVNLLSNAIKFSPAGESIVVTVEGMDDWIKISVRDNGPGFAEQHKDLLFDSYKQAPGTPDSEVRGSGLGLALSKAIVEGHGGVLEAENLDGKGSLFWFTVPAQDMKKISDG